MPLFLLIGLGFITGPAIADDFVEDDLNLWSSVHLDIPVHEKLYLKVSAEPRLGRNLTDMTQMLITGTGGVHVNDHLDVGVGYGYLTLYDPFIQEHRVWPEASIKNKFNKDGNRPITLSSRLRMEVNFRENLPEPVFRGRHLIKVKQPINERWYWTANNELFWNVSSVSGGVFRQGFDQNRTYVGVGRKLNETLTVEGGYMLMYFNRYGNLGGDPRPGPGVDLINHTLMLKLAISP